MTAAQKDLSVAHVIDMFNGLDLPVTDDGQQIEAKGNELQKLYLRRKGSPDPQQRNAADSWFKRLASLKDDRRALLEIVRAHFTHLADISLDAASSAGIKELTPKLYAGLERLAAEECKCDPPLARQFVEDYLQEQHLEIGNVFVRPGRVENFAAVSRLGQVSLSWSLPTSNCDEIEIVRETEITTPGNAPAETKTIYPERDTTSFIDSAVVPGIWYSYTAHAIFQGVPGTDAVARAVCMGEVRNLRASWQDGKVRLTWELPGPDTAVVVFRRNDGIPAIRLGSNGLEPADESTQRLYPQQTTSLEDYQLIEDLTYYYRVVIDFGQGRFTAGADVDVRVPKAPLAVSTLTAVYTHVAGKDEVVLEWTPVPDDRTVEYVVVRREGNTPPVQVKDGELVATTTKTRCLDEQVTPGCRYSYAVFSRVGQIYSSTGTSAPPIDILTEVADLRVQTGDETVELYWRVPANVSRVIVRRGVDSPREHTDGEPVLLTSTGSAKDEGLTNGQRYHYLVCCAYRPLGTAELVSAGLRIEAIPERLPEQVKDFAVRAEAREVICAWAAPAYGQVVVVRSARPLDLEPGARLAANRLGGLGDWITTEDNRARDAQPDIDKPYYSVFTVAGAHAIAGGSSWAIVCPDITDLRLSATRDGVILRWAWPPGITGVRVVRRLNTWPTGPADPEAIGISYSRVEYMTAGDKFVDTIQQGQWHFYYIVYAQASGLLGQAFAPGSDPGCRAVIQWEPWMTLRYRLSAPAGGSQKGKAIQLTWSVEQPFPSFAGFALVASEVAPPVALDDGVELFRWQPTEDQAAGAHQAWVSLTPIQQRRWSRFFCKVIPIDPAQRHITLVIHPDVCIPISDQGELQLTRRDNPTHGYHSGVPQTITCPYCFEEFPVERMLFDSFSGGEPLNARYTLTDRLLRRPPQPPRNEQGQRLTRKLCPNHRHVLPFTAGAQASLVIGSIGAKFSGKSHYIAALIERLEEQVGADLQAALLPVTDETQERYRREFYDPLFKNYLELPLTIGTPPPLIYDLTIDGKLFGEKRNRAITLALYDTAGENLKDASIARQMVQYLRVASGIMFLVDPLQIAGIRAVLPSAVQPPELDQEAAPNQIIANVLQLLEDGAVVQANAPLSIPVAVVLTKCDVLRDAGLIEANRLWNTDKRHIGYFDSEAHADMSGMIGECLQRWSPAAYSNIKRRFSRHAFFGVSATGCASDQITRRYKYISPWRAEDPVLWLLAELGVIPTR